MGCKNSTLPKQQGAKVDGDVEEIRMSESYSDALSARAEPVDADGVKMETLNGVQRRVVIGLQTMKTKQAITMQEVNFTKILLKVRWVH